MEIRIVRAGQESDWTNNTKRFHRGLRKNPPEAVTIHLLDFYPGSPDGNIDVRLTFAEFNALAREFILKQKSQERWDQRHLLRKAYVDTIAAGEQFATADVESDYVDKEDKSRLPDALATLSKNQRRRLVQYAVHGKSQRSIARTEGVARFAVAKSVAIARRKINIFLG